MPSPSATPTPITPPRVPLINQRTGLIDRAWYMFFLSLNNAATNVDNGDVGPSAESLIASYDAALRALSDEVGTQPPAIDYTEDITNLRKEKDLNPSPETGELQAQINDVRQELGLLPRVEPAVTSVTGTSPVASSGGTTPAISLESGYGDTQNPYAAKTANYVLAAPNGSSGVPTFRALVAADIPALPYGTGTVTSVSVTSANGFTGTVATATTTPAITLTTSITGLLYGNGTALAAATISSPLSYSAGTLSIPAANGSTNGYLTSTDWTTFNSKQPAGTYVTSVTGTAPVVSSGGTTPAISMAAANTSTNGYLSSTDWNTFNNKQTTSAPVTYTANFSVAATDAWIINNKSGSSCTATLPAASSYSGRVLHFQNYQAQTLISASSNVVPLVGGAAGTSILLASSGDSATLVSDGSNWLMTQYVPNNILLLE